MGLVRRHDDGSGVFQNVLDFGAVELWIDWHDAHSRTAACEIGLHPFRLVPQDDGDVLRPRSKRESGTIGLRRHTNPKQKIRPRPRLPFLGLIIPKRRGLRRLLRKFLQTTPNCHIHSNFLCEIYHIPPQYSRGATIPLQRVMKTIQ